ncbi:MAG: TMEM175 family protein, partial [Ilumatobacteraceae bacterium]
VDRIIFFSDAVVAIAISLLILPVVDQFADDSGRTLADMFSDEAGSLLAFVLSFVVIARFWLVHHQIFERVTGYTTPMIVANMLWLLTIVFLPLPTQLAGTNDDNDKLVFAIYIGSLVVVSASIMLLVWTMQIAPEVHADPQDPPRAIDGLTITLMMALALVLAVTVPGLGMSAMAVVFLASPIEYWRQKRLKSRAGRPLP